LDGCFVEVISTNIPHSIVVDHPTRASVVLATNSEEEKIEWCKFLEEACTVTFDKKSPFQDMKERLSQKNSSKKPISLAESLGEVSISDELGLRSSNEIGIPSPKWFILKKNILFQCSQKTNEIAIDALELEDYALNVLPPKNGAYPFEVFHPTSSSWTLYASSSDIRENWMKLLNTSIELVRDFSDNLKADAIIRDQQKENGGKKKKKKRTPVKEDKEEKT